MLSEVATMTKLLAVLLLPLLLIGVVVADPFCKRESCWEPVGPDGQMCEGLIQTDCSCGSFDLPDCTGTSIPPSCTSDPDCYGRDSTDTFCHNGDVYSCTVSAEGCLVKQVQDSCSGSEVCEEEVGLTAWTVTSIDSCTTSSSSSSPTSPSTISCSDGSDIGNSQTRTTGGLGCGIYDTNYCTAFGDLNSCESAPEADCWWDPEPQMGGGVNGCTGVRYADATYSQTEERSCVGVGASCVAPSGSFTFTSSVCDVVEGSSSCTGTISWSTSDASDVKVFTESGGAMASGTSGTSNPSWVRPLGHSQAPNTLSLYAGCTDTTTSSCSTLLDTEDLYGECEAGTVWDSGSNSCVADFPSSISIIFSDSSSGSSVSEFSLQDTIYGRIDQTDFVEGCASSQSGYSSDCWSGSGAWASLPAGDWSISGGFIRATFSPGSTYHSVGSYTTGARISEDTSVSDTASFDVVECQVDGECPNGEECYNDACRSCVDITGISVSDSSPLEGSSVVLRCSASPSGHSNVAGSISGDGSCSFSGTWSGSDAIFDCDVGSAGSKTLTCGVQNRCQIGSDMSTTINVQSSDCSTYGDSSSCTGAPASCEWCSGPECQDGQYKANAGTCVDSGSCPVNRVCSITYCEGGDTSTPARCDTGGYSDTCTSLGYDGGSFSGCNTDDPSDPSVPLCMPYTGTCYNECDPSLPYGSYSASSDKIYGEDSTYSLNWYHVETLDGTACQFTCDAPTPEYDSATNSCVECLDNNDCSSGATCSSGVCKSGDLTYTNPVCTLSSTSATCNGNIEWTTDGVSTVTLETDSGATIASGLSGDGSYSWSEARHPDDVALESVVLVGDGVSLDTQSFEASCPSSHPQYDSSSNRCVECLDNNNCDGAQVCDTASNTCEDIKVNLDVSADTYGLVSEGDIITECVNPDVSASCSVTPTPGHALSINPTDCTATGTNTWSCPDGTYAVTCDADNYDASNSTSFTLKSPDTIISGFIRDVADQVVETIPVDVELLKDGEVIASDTINDDSGEGGAYSFTVNGVGEYVLTATAENFDLTTESVDVECGVNVPRNLSLLTLSCGSDCTSGFGVCNYDCVGDGCELDDLADDANNLSDTGDLISKEELETLLMERCSGASPGDLRAVPGYLGHSFVCCGGLGGPDPVQEFGLVPATVESDARHLVSFTKIVNYGGLPVKMNVFVKSD